MKIKHEKGFVATRWVYGTPFWTRAANYRNRMEEFKAMRSADAGFRCVLEVR